MEYTLTNRLNEDINEDRLKNRTDEFAGVLESGTPGEQCRVLGRLLAGTTVSPVDMSLIPALSGLLVGIGSDSLKALILRYLERLGDHPNSDIRQVAIEVLLRSGSPGAAAIIRKRLQDSNIRVLHAAITALGKLEDNAGADEIENIVLSANSLMVTCTGLETLSRLKRSPRRALIIAKFMTHHAHPAVTFPFLAYLKVFGGKEAWTYIEKAIDINGVVYSREIIDAIEGILTTNHLSTLPFTLQKRLQLIKQKTNRHAGRRAVKNLLIRCGCIPRQSERSDRVPVRRATPAGPLPVNSLPVGTIPVNINAVPISAKSFSKPFSYLSSAHKGASNETGKNLNRRE